MNSESKKVSNSIGSVVVSILREPLAPMMFASPFMLIMCTYMYFNNEAPALFFLLAPFLMYMGLLMVSIFLYSLFGALKFTGFIVNKMTAKSTDGKQGAV